MMRYIAAACLTALAGKEVNADNIEKILRYFLLIFTWAIYKMVIRNLFKAF